MGLAKKQLRHLKLKQIQNLNNSKEENALKKLIEQLKWKGFTAEMFFRVCDQRFQSVIEVDRLNEVIHQLGINLNKSEKHYLLNLLDEEHQGTISLINLQCALMTFGYQCENHVNQQFNQFQQTTLIEFLRILIDQEISGFDFSNYLGRDNNISRKQFMDILLRLNSEFTLKQRFVIFGHFDVKKEGEIQKIYVQKQIENLFSIFKKQIEGYQSKKQKETQQKNQQLIIQNRMQAYQQKREEERAQYMMQTKIQQQPIALKPNKLNNKILPIKIIRPLKKAQIDILQYFLKILEQDKNEAMKIFKKADLQKVKLVKIQDIRQIIENEYYSSFNSIQLNMLTSSLDVNNSGFIGEDEYQNLILKVKKQNNPYKNQDKASLKKKLKKNDDQRTILQNKQTILSIEYDIEKQPIKKIKIKEQDFKSENTVRDESILPLIANQSQLCFDSSKIEEQEIVTDQSDSKNLVRMVSRFSFKKNQIVSQNGSSLFIKEEDNEDFDINEYKFELSFQGIKDYIIKNHPHKLIKANQQNEQSDLNSQQSIIDQQVDQTDEYQKFGIFESVGNYLISKYITKSFQKHLTKIFGLNSEITELSKEIGLGPSLLLLSTKSLAIFFFIATIINIPNYFILNQKYAPQVDSLQDALSYISIGNLGSNSLECQSINLHQQNVTLQCNTLQATLQDIKYIGYPSQNSICKNIKYDNYFKYDSYFQQDCIFSNSGNYQQTLFDPANFSLLQDTYNTSCKGKGSCTLNSSLFQTQQCSQNQSLPQNKHESQLTILIDCQVINLEIYISGQSTIVISKDTCVLIVMITDFITIGLFLAFIWLIHKQQGEYIRRFDKQTIEMSDFTVRMKNIPKPSVFENDERILKMKLWFQINQVIKHQIVKQQIKTGTFQKIDFFESKYQIADISFSKQNIEKELTEHQKFEKKKDICKQLKIEEMQKQKTLSKFQQHVKKIKNLFGIDSIDKMKNELKQLQVKLENINKQSMTNFTLFPIKDYQKFGFSQSSPYIDKDEANKNKIINAFVVFRSMEGAKLFKKAYKNSGGFEKYLTSLLFLLSKKYYNIKFINGKWPSVQVADNPVNVNWKTMGVKIKQRLGRQLLLQLITIFVVIITLIFTIQLTIYTNNQKLQFKISAACPSSVLKPEALHDVYLSYEMQLGLMHCYCYEKVIRKVNIANLYESFQDINKTDATMWCSVWNQNFLKQTSFKYGQPIVILVINVIFSQILINISSFGKYQSVSGEIQSGFKKITILQYLNISILILIANFNIYGGIPQLGIFNGIYDDFNQEWFVNIGGSICITIFFKIFTPYAMKIFFIFLQFIKRTRDRRNYNSGISGLRKDKNKDEVNSSLIDQHDLELLYTDSEISAPEVYAQIISFLWSTMTFSAGLPVLYPISCLNFIIFYWMYKILILKFLSKSKKLDQGIARLSIRYMLISVILHITMTGMMFSSNLMQISSQYQINQFMNQFSSILIQYSQITHFLNNRFLEANGIIYLIYIVVLISCIPSFIFAYKFIKKLIGYFYSYKDTIDYAAQKEMNAQSDDIFQELDLEQLFKQYKIASIENGLINQQQEYFLSKFEKYEFEEIQKLYKKRYEDIYKLIFDYYCKMDDNDECPEDYNLYFLNMKQDQIQKINKYLSSNQNQNIFRMNGLIQSYNIEDSTLFRHKDELQNKILEEKIGDKQKTESFIKQDDNEENIKKFIQQESSKVKQKIGIIWLIITLILSIVLIAWTLSEYDQQLAISHQFQQIQIFIILNLVSHIVNIIWTILYVIIIFINKNSVMIKVAQYFKLVLIILSIGIDVYGVEKYYSPLFQNFILQNIVQYNSVFTLIGVMVWARFCIFILIIVISPCWIPLVSVSLSSKKEFDDAKIDKKQFFKVKGCLLKVKEQIDACPEKCEFKLNSDTNFYFCQFDNHFFHQDCKQKDQFKQLQSNKFVCPKCQSKYFEKD